MTEPVIRDLGDGLVLRRATPADADALAEFNGRVLGEMEGGGFHQGYASWTRDLATRPHPTFDVGDFSVVEDTRTGAIASSLCLISQTWSYDGVEFGVGMPDLVGTDPAYRRRGLVRAQFEVVHRWSAERGQQVQAITGIPYFYRQFGYEMAMDLWGVRVGYRADIPDLPVGDAEPYRVRPADEGDLPFIAELYREGAKRGLVSCVRDAEIWRYELRGRSADSDAYHELRVVETPAGEPVGYLAHRPGLWHGMVMVVDYELAAGSSWSAVTPTVLRYLKTTGDGYARRQGSGEFGGYVLMLLADHPAFRLAARYFPRAQNPYAWYLRVADLPGLLRTIAPALERHLAGSDLAGHSGKLELSSYRAGARLVFEAGRVVASEPWQPTQAERGSAWFPNLTFLNLLFGRQSPEELERAYPDAGIRDDETRELLHVLFPKRSSSVWKMM